MHRLTELVLRFPRPALVLLCAVTVILGAGLPNVRTEFGYRVLLGPEHPSIRTLEGMIEEFGGGLPIQIAWLCGDGHPCASVFDPVSLAMAAEITDALAPVEGVRTVEGVANAPLLVPTHEGFDVRRFVEDGRPTSDAAALATQAVRDPFWRNLLVSPDAAVGVVVVQTVDTRNETESRVVRAIQETLKPFEERGFTYHVVGDSYSAVVAGGELAASMMRVIPMTVLAIVLILLLLTRSFVDAAWALATTGVSLLWTFGLLGWLGWPRDAILEILASLVLAIGACDTVHFLARYRSAQASHTGTSVDTLLRAARDVGRPCLITTLTTAGALLSFCTSNLQTFIRFGVLSAFGVVACLVLTFTLLPLLVRAVPGRAQARARQTSEFWDASLQGLLRMTSNRAFWILGCSAGVLLLGIFGWIARLQVDTYWYELIGENSRIVRSIRFLEDRLRPIDTLEIQIRLPLGVSIAEPGTLESIDRLGARLGQLEGLGLARSLVDYVARANRLLHGDDPAWDRPADTLAGNEEILDLISFTEARALDPWLSFDRSKARVSVEARISPNQERRRILRAVTAILAEELPADWSVTLSGPLAMNHDWTRDIQQTQLWSFPTAFLLIGLMVAVFLRSLRLALAAMIPTVLPVIVTLGVMGWLGVNLDVGRAMIAAVLLGVAVDDSVHLLTQYKRRRAVGDAPRQAMSNAVLHVGRAVVTTSLALSLGFLTLMASAWQTISSFGFFVALAVLGALAADLLIIPAIIFAVSPRDGDLVAEQVQSPLGETSRANVHLLVLAVLAPPALALIISGSSLATLGPRWELGCWVLPNNRVALFAGSVRTCPLRPHEALLAIQDPAQGLVRIDQFGQVQGITEWSTPTVSVAVIREGRRQWHEIRTQRLSWNERGLRWLSALLGTVVILCLPVVLLWKARSRAAAPFAFLYSALSVILILLVSGRNSVWLNRMALVASVFAPAVLSHLSLTFPRERRVLRESPGILLLPYGLSVILFLAAWTAMERNALLWPTVVLLLLALSLGAWGVLLLSCWFAVRESRSPLERNRARMLLFGGAFLPVLATPLLSRFSMDPPAALALYLGVAVLLIPLPIGVAISRYDLLSLGEDVRAWVSRLVYYAAAALTVTLLFETAWAMYGGDRPFLQPTLVFALSLVAIATIEAMRSRLLGWVEAFLSPRLERLRRLSSEYGQRIDELRDEQQVAKLLGETIDAALAPRSGCVFLACGSEWRPAQTFGTDPPARLDLVSKARRAAEGRRVVQIADVTEATHVAHATDLHEAGVELIAALEHAGVVEGFLLLAPSTSPSPYTRLDLDFVATAAHRAAVALHNARVAAELVASERRAVTGRTALALAHDVGKELGLIRSLARRLPERIGEPKRAERDLAMIDELAEDLLTTVRGFVSEATRAPVVSVGRATCREVLGRAVRAASRIHGPGRITQSAAPDVRGLEIHENLERVVVNLLDNALLAGDVCDPVHLFATREEGWLRITVSDRGCGMSDRQRGQAFELGFTTRPPGRGSGVGLAVSREIVHALGGSIELDANPGGGTVATVRVPLSSGQPTRSHPCSSP